jgi:hypothetical protein
MDSNRIHHRNLAQTTKSNHTTVNSHLDGWKTTTLIKTHVILNIIKMEDLYGTHDCRAKLNYPSIKPNHKGINVGVQFKECMQYCELEGESI